MRFRVFLLAISLGLLVPHADAQAATCSQYDTQADAQRAADTRDADGDGVYCEALPCPCLKPGGRSQAGGGSGERSSRREGRTSRERRTMKIRGRISSVVDGDTLKIRADDARRRWYTVRLIGIDTPETKRPGVAVECGGRHATHHMLDLAFTAPQDTDGDGLFDRRGGTGRAVWVRTDPTQDTFDRYGRLLAYVTTRSAPKNLALEQLRSGWADLYVFEDRFREHDRFRRAARRAAERDRGVWDRCGGDFHTAR